MTAAVLCVGTEITRGEIVNTNATWLAERLTAIGFEVAEVANVGDDRDRLVAALQRLGAQHDILVCTGGLGPTSDDLTTACAAMAAGVPLVRDPSSVAAIREKFALFRRTMVASNVKQADFPSGATVMANAVGTAPGFAMRMGRALALFFPGVPRELAYLWNEHAEPMLQTLAPSDTFQMRLRTFGKPESTVAEMLAGVEAQHPGVTIGYRASIPEIEVKIFGRGANRYQARARVCAAEQHVRTLLGDIVYGQGDDTFVGTVAAALRKKGYRIAVAESCTGGLLAQLFTSAPASDYFVAGFVTYQNTAKTALLGVPEEMLAQHGAVSEPVAIAMAEGAARISRASVGVGITGVAGPTGGSASKPVGTVYFAVAYPGGSIARHRVFPGDRNRIQRFAAYAALALVREVCR